MKKYIFLLSMLLSMNAYATSKDCPICDNIQKHIKDTLPKTHITAVTPSPLLGVYEVLMGKNIMYTDQNANLFLIGHIFNPTTNTDLTAQRMTEIKQVSFDSLPLQDAIVSGDKGGKKLAIFTDPECPFCRKLEKTLQRLHGIEVYTFLFPLTQLHPDAERKARNIWCAPDRHQALIDSMLNYKILPDRNCATPIERNKALAQRLDIQGTPTLISGDGKIMHGMPRTEAALLEWLK